MTNTFSSSADTSSEMPYVQTWSIGLRTGGGDHCGDGNRSSSLIPGCFRRGRFPDCRNGWNQSPDAFTWSPQRVHEDGNKFDGNQNCPSKTPDPFDCSDGVYESGLKLNPKRCRTGYTAASAYRRGRRRLGCGRAKCSSRDHRFSNSV